MRWREILAKADDYLSSKGVDDSRLAAELLAARLLSVGRGFLASRYDEEADPRLVDAMRRGVVRLASGEPVQYVLGEWDFRSLTLKCDRRALIPRPETEELVSRVLKHLQSREFASPPVVVDVGTGTGAIILSLAKEYAGEGIFIGTDLSGEAIGLARENAEKCGLAGKVKFALADGLDEFDEPEMIDVIVSNPPYIESHVCETLDPKVRDFEPRMALDGGASGLEFYERYLADAINVLRREGAVFFEIGENQGPAIRQMMFDYGFENIAVERDFAGHDRYAFGILP
jgi:release factor glutamine methyltransferase